MEQSLPTETDFVGDLQLIVPNLHRRYSGVTATNRMVAPRLARLLHAAWLGSDAPDGIARMRSADLLKLWRRRSAVIWHARRNNEMIAGILLRLLGWPLKLVFTSAAQRHHTWITRWLIRRMDAIIATSEVSASYLKRGSTVIPHGVDIDVYAPPPNRAAAFTEGGLPGAFAIGCFGRVRAQKGSDVFVDAMCRLLPHYPDFTAVIVGAIFGIASLSTAAGFLAAGIATLRARLWRGWRRFTPLSAGIATCVLLGLDSTTKALPTGVALYGLCLLALGIALYTQPASAPDAAETPPLTVLEQPA